MAVNKQELIELYTDIRFSLSQPNTQALPNPFAIITAWNPRSETHNDAFNQAKNAELAAELEAVYHAEITGSSPDLSYQESGFLVQISKPLAIGLAEKYQQNAIYWVEQDELHLVPVLMEFDELRIGTFSSKLLPV